MIWLEAVNNSPEQTRLLYVISAYNTLVNIKTNYFLRQISKHNGKNNVFATNYKSIFGYGGKYRSSVKLTDGKTILFGSGTCSVATNDQLTPFEAGYDVSGMNTGTEKQYTNLGNINGKDVIYVSARKNSPSISVDKPTFDLSEWTRALGVSYDWGRTFMQTDYIRPQYTNNILSENSKIPDIIKHGFISSEVKSSMVSIPDFRGRGNPLVIHAHPSNATKGYINLKNGDKEIKCLGSAGDASKGDHVRCDYRMNMMLLAGVRNRSLKSGARPNASGAVNWDFKNGLVVNKGPVLGTLH